MRLRLLTDSIGKDIEKSIKKSDLQDVNISVDADTLAAEAGLEATKIKADELDGKNVNIKTKVDTKDAKKDIHALTTAIALIGPTIGPVGAAAAGAFGALAAGAGVAILAVKGVQKEIKAGMTVGVQFSTGMQTLKGDLSKLEATAARGVLPGFQATVTALNSSLPGVNHSVGNLSQILGDIGAHVITGLVSGLQTFEPLLTHIGIAADTAAGHFQSWATGPGGAKFAESLGKQFDLVVPVLAHLAEAVGKLIAAFAPIGDHIVGIIGALADAINAIPLPVLTTLANIFITLYSASKLVTLFRNLSISMVAFGASAGTTSIALGTIAIEAAGFTAALGPLAAALGGGYLATQAFGDQLDKVANKFATGKILKSVSEDATGDLNILSNALIDVGGSADASAAQVLRFALSGKLVGQGLGEISDKTAALVGDFAKLGVNADQVTSAVGGSDAVFTKFIDTIQKHGGATKQDIDTLNKLHDAFKFTIDSTNATRDALVALTKDPAWKTLSTSGDSVAQVAAKFGISADAVTKYTSLLGISDDAIKNGVITNQQLASAVKTVSTAYDTASTTGAAFLDSLSKFSTSAGTAADRAQLISATLKAAAGDTLSYQTTLNGAAQAEQGLATAIHQAADSVGKSGISTKAYLNSIVDLKKGTIDYKNAAAGPLLTSLGQIQQAALDSASAVFQHNRALGVDGKKAADEAYKTYVSQTGPMLEKQLTALGLNKDAAHKLAEQYEGVPDKVKTLIEQEGANPVVTVLNKIGEQLAYLTGHPWVPKVSANTAAAKHNINGVNDALHGLRGKTIVVGANTYAAQADLNRLNANIQSMLHPIITPRVAGAQGRTIQAKTGGLVQYRASGGPSGQVRGPGSGTSDTAGLFALSNGEYVINARSTQKYLPLIRAINSNGMASGGMAASSGGMDMSSILAEIRALAVALANRPVQLVASNGGQPLAKIVNDANLANARRLGQ